MANKVGKLIKEARTAAGFTQEELAKKVKGITASEVSKAERGELELTQEVLKKIAKITGVTQKSLLEAALSSTYKKAAAKTSGAKTSSSASSSMKLTAQEKSIIELYRKADADTKKKVKALLKGEGNALENIFSSLTGEKKPAGNSLSSILTNAAKDLLK